MAFKKIVLYSYISIYVFENNFLSTLLLSTHCFFPHNEIFIYYWINVGKFPIFSMDY